MINSISSIGIHSNQDYTKIMQEMRQLGLKPTGNMQVDTEKLNQEKQNLIEKIQHKEETSQAGNGHKPFQAQLIAPVDNADNTQRTALEHQKPGQIAVADLLKLYHGLN